MEEQIQTVAQLAKELGAENFCFKSDYSSKDSRYWYIIYLYFDGYTSNAYDFDFNSCLVAVAEKAKADKEGILKTASKLLQHA